MNIEQMMGRYQRLRQELSIAYNQQPWQSGRIDRLTLELAQVEREIAARQYEVPHVPNPTPPASEHRAA